MNTRQWIMAGIVLAVSTAMTSCDIRHIRITTDDGDRVTQVRHYKDFEEIDISGSPTVVYTQADSFSVHVEGPEEQVKNILTTVEGKVLSIHNRGKMGIFNFTTGIAETTVYVTSPDLVAVRLSGSGDFRARYRVDTDELSIVLRGSGDISFDDIICDHCTTDLTGSGDININRLEAQTSNVTLVGSGDVDVEQVKVRETDVLLRGSGDVVVNFVEGCRKADCQLTGSGDITLRGHLQRYNGHKNGSGDIHINDLTIDD